MASTSTVAEPISSSGDYGYDVFINHRGPDTKRTFGSHLYYRLRSEGFKAFLDQRELQEGLNFPSQIEDAIKSASVHVAIFSPGYAKSRWCLDELLRMQESRAPIIPVFYYVKPAELRWTTENKNGVYAKALLEHQKTPQYDSTTIQNWRNALSSVAGISGFELEAFNGDEGEMLDKLVERVVKMAKRQLYVAKYPTGLDEKVKDFETTVLRQQHTGKVRLAGIVGLGGVGKTTLALEFFNRRRSEYKKSYFLSDVRENAKSSLHSLQSKLLKGLNLLDRHIDDTHQGTEILRTFLSSSQVLLVLDDIDHKDRVDALLPDRDVLSSDSLILITSRDKDVLTKSGVEESSIYKLTGLSTQHSRELFCSYACPPRGLEDMIHKFLMVCDGLPLSLKVFGALLKGKNDKSHWQHRLDQVQVPIDIHERLKISYDALSGEEQQIFLDIAYFFIGEKTEVAIRIWDESGWDGLFGFENLKNKCLVEVDSDNYIYMHEHLRDLGRQIGKDTLPHRLWCPTENIGDGLHSSVITEARGITMLPDRHSTKGGGVTSQMLSWYQRKSHELLGNRRMTLRNRLQDTHDCLPGIGVKNLPKLQILQSEGHLLEHILRRVHCPNLIWLSWRNCPYTYLPSCIPMNNLRVLKVQGRVLKTLWQGKSQAPLELRDLEIIDVEHLLNLPKSIGRLKNLERIVVDCDCNLSEDTGLESLPDSFGNLTNLKHMDVSFRNLVKLPDFFGNLKNLQHIYLSGCQSLQRLPDSFGYLTKLQNFHLFGCKNLQGLPESFGGLAKLQNIHLSGCGSLQGLPESFGDLVNLQRIHLSGCGKLWNLPDSFVNLTNLQRIDLSWCGDLRKLPVSLGNLMNLQHIHLSGCENLQRLADSLGNLKSLQNVHLSGCENLEALPETFGNLTNLQRIHLSGCGNFQGLPDSFGELMNLQRIHVSCKCNYLMNVQELFERLPDSFGNLRNLQHIYLSCWSLKRLPDSLGNLLNLQHMDLSGCKKLESLPDCIGNLRNLQRLDLSQCQDLGSLPESFGNLTNLLHIQLFLCSNLQRLPNSFGSLISLKYLGLSSCPNLTISSDTLGNISTLESMDLSDCEKIEVWPLQLAHQRSLKKLYMQGTNFKYLPSEIGFLSDLEVLYIGSPLLHTLPPSLGDLRNLKILTLEDCRGLKHLPASIGLLTQLTELRVLGCPLIQLSFRKANGETETLRRFSNLDSSIDRCMPRLQYLELESTEISEVSFNEGVCPNLQYFTIIQCNNMVEVGTLPNTLTHVKLISCDNLRKIEGLCSLAKLQTLEIKDCKKVQGLPSIKRLVSLEQLETSDCVRLKSIQDLRQLRMLQSINVSGCRELEELEGAESCISLRELDASGCPKLLRAVKKLHRRKPIRIIL